MSDSRPAPYPSDTRAKGWRFELDYEQIAQSDTWSLAAEVAMCQHALLMMWLVAWGQTPCGSLPADDGVIRAKCHIPAPTWSKCRDVLMRGWWRADDGRLYHPTLTARVLEMMRRRRSDSDRKAQERIRKAAAIPVTPDAVSPESRATPVGVTRESSTDNRQPNTSTGTEKEGSGVPKTERPRARKRAAPAELVSVEALVAEGVSQRHAEDWLRIRADKNLPLTRTAWQKVKDEAAVAAMSAAAVVETCAGEGWAGFKVKWLAERTQGMNGHKQTSEKARRAQHEDAAAGAKALLFGATQLTDVLNA